MEVIRGEKQFRMKIYHNVAVKEKHSSSLNILLYSSTSDTKLVGLGGGIRNVEQFWDNSWVSYNLTQL